jgi:dinuclear metal center YbgI/SA1388 family protein
MKKTVTRQEILKYLDEIFAVSMMPDYSYNGLQFEGKEEVRKIVAGVDAHVDFFKEAGKRGADFALVHHGLFWKGGEWSKLDRINTKVVKSLLETNLNLFAMHLPLDAHPEFGNNALLAKMIGAKVAAPFGKGGENAIGYIAQLPKPVSIDDFVKTVETKVAPISTHLKFGKEKVQNIGIVSGGGGSYLASPQVYNGDIDLLLTGEVVHQNAATCRERGIHLIAAGHYNTEVCGIKEVGRLVAEKFGLEYEFIDMPTGL